jgi:hypothetical protein
MTLLFNIFHVSFSPNASLKTLTLIFLALAEIVIGDNCKFLRFCPDF